METIEKNRIIFDLENSNGNMTAAAKTLGISRQNLYKKMKKYDIKISE
jgi:transcriptional regulator of acetoin/glycerol metabolism